MTDRNKCIRRIYRVEPPEELTNSTYFTRWQPERLSIKKGIQETAIPILAGYILITAVSFIFCFIALMNLPPSVTLPTFFGYASITIPTPLFIAGMLAIHIYLIYRDLIRRSMARTLLLIPLVFFLAQWGILISL